ncbi:MAG: response regulator transcription factor [Caldilineaceae bacterium]
MTQGYQIPNEQNRAIRIVIISRHELVRVGLRAMLAEVLGWSVAGETFDETMAVALCRKVQPDLVLLDVQSLGGKGLGALRSLNTLRPTPKIIILTSDEYSDFMLEARQAGAVGYLFKDVTHQALIATIQNALSSETDLRKDGASDIPVRAKHQPKEGVVQSTDRLTLRELEVLHLVAKGFTNRDIAERLALRPGTVKVHVERIVAKLEVTNRMQAVLRAVELGLLQAPHLPHHTP